jgi:threonine/homoserine/homoserine lactone efflux protein
VISPGQLAAFAAIAAVILVVPGPSVLFVVGRALAYGRRTALASVVGNELGELVLAVSVAFGVGALVERSEVVFSAMKLLGAAYLVHLGVKAWRQRRLLAVLDEQPPARSSRRAVRDGFVVGVANPKAAVFFTAVLPEFADKGRGHVTLQLLVLALVWVALALVSDGVWALAASRARSWLGREPRRLAMIGGSGGVAMIGLGVAIAVTGRRQ